MLTRRDAVRAAKADLRVQVHGWFVLIGYQAGGWAYSCPGVRCRLPDLCDIQISYRRAARGCWYTA